MFVLSIKEIIRWLKANTGRGKLTIDQPLPFRAMCRDIGFTPQFVYMVRDGKRKCSNRFQTAMSRFIRDWENGMIDATPRGRAENRACITPAKLTRRTTPKATPVRLTVSLGVSTAPRLAIIPKPPMNTAFPSFKTALGVRVSKR